MAWRPELSGAGPGSSALELSGVSVVFGGVHALTDVDMVVPAAGFTGLIGPNGAGKTTLFNVVTGLVTPTAGTVRFGGVDITRTPAHARVRMGIGRTFQHLELFTSLTVRENVLAAAASGAKWRHRAVAPSSIADDVIELLGLRSVAAERAGSLTTGVARLVEVARAIALDPRLLLLDEPSAGLDQSESRVLATALAPLADSRAILLVEHDVDFVMSLCNHVYVLDLGRMLASGSPEAVRDDPAVQVAYLGARPEPVAHLEPAVIPRRRRRGITAGSTEGIDAAPAVVAAAPVLELRDVVAGYGAFEVLHRVSLRVGRGEIVALVGPNGAGKSTVAKTVAGDLTPAHGCFHIMGRHVNGIGADRLARAGVCTLPEGRGIFPNLTVAENLRLLTYSGVALSTIEQATFDRFPLLRQRKNQVAGTLSGGEQQMLAMARCVSSQPALLLLDELSSGLAPQIVSSLYEVVRDLAARGTSVLLIEQFTDTALALADRVVVLARGRVAFEGTPDEITEERLSAAYLGRATEQGRAR